MVSIRYIDNPYHKGFNWEVDYGCGKQWFKSKEEAENAKAKWG